MEPAPLKFDQPLKFGKDWYVELLFYFNKKTYVVGTH